MQVETFGNVDQVEYVFLEAATTETNGSLQAEIQVMKTKSWIAYLHRV